MGVPKLASWLTKKYPSISSVVIPSFCHGLYVDLNGLIHPCCHDEDDLSVAKRPEQEKIRQICLAVDTLVVTVEPKKVLYIAVDGVAPRAKMNQQRARRYMGRSETLEPLDDGLDGATIGGISELEGNLDADAHMEEIRKTLDTGLYDTSSSSGAALQPPVEEEAPKKTRPTATAATTTTTRTPAEPGAFDSNCISPGTDFMMKVSAAMQKHIQEKLLEDPLWKALTVVFSDTRTPGEGEHKIIDFIRTQASYPGFLGNGSHIIAGLDADLIFLSLSLHIPNVFILRDNKRPSKFNKPAVEPAKKEAELKETPDPDPLKAKESDEESTSTASSESDSDAVEAGKYEYFSVDVIGASIMSEMYGLSVLKKISWEKHASEIVSSGGYQYNRNSNNHGGNAARDESRDSAAQKEKHASGTGANNSQKGDEKREPRGSSESKSSGSNSVAPNPCAAPYNCKVIDDFIVLSMLVGNDFLPHIPSAFCGEGAIDDLIELYVGEVLPYGFLTSGNHEINLSQLARLMRAYSKVEAMQFRQFCIQNTKMTVDESGAPLGSASDNVWITPYMETTGLKGEVSNACGKYVEGLRFVWRYYSSTSAQCSWSWFYPYHFCPFAFQVADFLSREDLAKLPAAPMETTPPNLYSQLMCILPETSAALLPAVYGEVMCNPEKYEKPGKHSLADTFPREWQIDYTAAYGKEHLATVRIPFADMPALNEIVQSKKDSLSEEEIHRMTQKDFHVVLRAAKNGSSVSTSEASHDTFVLSGDVGAVVQGGPSADAAKVSNGLDIPLTQGIEYSELRESKPQVTRPRTYSCNIPIPNVTSLSDGTVYRPDHKSRRRGFRFKANKKSSDEIVKELCEHFKEQNAKASARSSLSSTSLGEFYIILVLTTLATICVASQTWYTCFVGLLEGGAVAAFGFFVLSALGIVAPSQIRNISFLRNVPRSSYVDWQCARCLRRNFSKNNRCFFCYAPYDEKSSCAIYSSKYPADPPVMDPDHSKLLKEVRLIVQG